MKRILCGFCILITTLSYAQNAASGEEPDNSFVIHVTKSEMLGSQLNTDYSEFLPLVSAQGDLLYFVRRAHPRNMGPDDQDDIWMAYLKPDGSWTRAVNVGAPLNNQGGNAVLSIHPFGNLLYLKRTEPGSNGAGIAYTVREKRSWSQPVHMPVEDYFNHSAEADFYVDPLEEVLLLSVDRGEEGFGGRDLYVAFKTADNKGWERPLNLGSVINTPGEEACVFLGQDGKSLYFSSDSHEGIGGLDLFVSRRLDDSWTNWSTPQNLGQGINSSGDDQYISYSTALDYIYFSRKNTNGHYNLFRARLPEEFKPEPVLLLTGRIEEKRVPNLEDSDTLVNKNLKQTFDGSYAMTIPVDAEKELYDRIEGYYPVNERTAFSEEELGEVDVDPWKFPADLAGTDVYQQGSRNIAEAYVQMDNLERKIIQLEENRKNYLSIDPVANIGPPLTEHQDDPEMEALRDRYENYLDYLQDSMITPALVERLTAGRAVRSPRSDQGKSPEILDPLGPAGSNRESSFTAFEDLGDEVRMELQAELLPQITESLIEESLAEIQQEVIDRLDLRDVNEIGIEEDALRTQLYRNFVAGSTILHNARKRLGISNEDLNDIKADLKRNQEEEVRREWTEAMRSKVRTALRVEMTYHTLLQKCSELQAKLDQHILQQIEWEKEAGYLPATIPDGSEVAEIPAEHYPDLKKNIHLYPIAKAQIIPLQSVTFHPNTAVLKLKSYAELSQLALLLKKHPDWVVELGAHCNGQGSYAFADQLSQKRANAIAQYFWRQGLSKEKVTFKGYGKTRLLNSDQTLEGRRKNQRIELKILDVKQ